MGNWNVLQKSNKSENKRKQKRIVIKWSQNCRINQLVERKINVRNTEAYKYKKTEIAQLLLVDDDEKAKWKELMELVYGKVIATLAEESLHINETENRFEFCAVFQHTQVHKWEDWIHSATTLLLLDEGWWNNQT